MFQCPHCSQFMDGDDTLFGTEIECPNCKQAFLAPERPAVAPLQAQPLTPAPRTSEADLEEVDVFEIFPAAKAFLPQIALGVLFLVLTAPVYLLVGMVTALPWILTGVPLLVLLAGVYILARVWIKTKSVSYRLTTQRFIVRHGLIGRIVNEVELYRVKDVTVHQTFLQRLMSVGGIRIISNDDAVPVLLMEGIIHPLEVKELLRKQYRACRRREGVRTTELDQP